MHGYRCLSLTVVKIGIEAHQIAEPLFSRIRAVRGSVLEFIGREFCNAS